MEKVGSVLREKILIVDDTHFHRAMAAEILGRSGYATVEVDNGARALDMVVSESPDLVILDSMMPDVDGLEVCRRLKDDPFTHHIPILIFTTMNTVSDKVHSLRNGADGYLGKPFTPDELIAQVEVLLRRSFHYDPLTKLPAAPYLHKQIDARLAQNLPAAVIYLDIDRFKSVNRVYGSAAGDEFLVRLARLCVDALPARGAFLGHLGSDDFIAVIPPEAAETFAQIVIDGFVSLRETLYSPEDRASGFVTYEGRRGELIRAPLVTLSAAIASNDRRALVNYVQVSDILAELMRYAKSQGGGQWVRDRRLR